jgi:peptidyl-prolyl isomerase E (cyclophilin E)
MSEGSILYVGNLHGKVDEKLLQAAFIPFGPVVSIALRIEVDGRSRGFAFVRFEEAEDAAEARLNMNRAELLDQIIHVDFAKQRAINDEPESAFSLPGE